MARNFGSELEGVFKSLDSFCVCARVCCIAYTALREIARFGGECEAGSELDVKMLLRRARHFIRQDASRREIRQR